MAFDFPTKPGGTVAELWQAVLRLLPQLGGKSTLIRGASVGTAETPIAHGLAAAPLAAVPVVLANVNAWQTRDPDVRFVYLQASAPTIMHVAVLR